MKTLIVCAGKNEVFSFAKSIGVGLIEASVGLTRLCLEKKPEKIVFIGSCGLYKKNDENALNLKAYTENSSDFKQEIQNTNMSFFKQEAQDKKAKLQAKNTCKQELKSQANQKENKALKLLEIYETRHCFNIEASKLISNFYSPAECEINLNVSYETKKCNSSNYICTDENIAEKFVSLGLELENMEAFAVLSVARHFKIPATCFLCATNFCDKDAHEFFLLHHAQAKKNLENFLQEKNLI